MASENSQNRASWRVAFGQAPRDGSKSMYQLLDFTYENPVGINLTYEQDSGKLEFVQSIYVDNSSNPYPLTCAFRSTQQTIIIPAGWQAYIPVLASADNCKASFSTTGGLTAGIMVPIHFLNFPVALFLWPSSVASPGTDGSANKPVLAANLIATVAVNSKRSFIEVQNQSASQIQLVLDDNNSGATSIILLAAGGANVQGASWWNRNFTGRLRVYAANTTDQVMVREY